MIIAIAGNREEAGKSTVGLILKYLLVEKMRKQDGRNSLGSFNPNFVYNTYPEENYQIKKFADTLKDFICTLIDKDRKWLEENKNTELEGWNIIKYYFVDFDEIGKEPLLFKTIEHAQNYAKTNNLIITGTTTIKHTPRTLMIQIANNLRETIHPDIWITPLLNQYYTRNYDCEHQECPIDLNCGCENVYPKWIIDDLRYPNEFERLKELGAITIYVERGEDKHSKSEGLLDKNDFNYVIDNNGDMSNLIKQVKEIYERIN